jgi:hypothetical protein
MNFIPEQTKNSADVPYFDEVTGGAGWQGQTTNKSAISRLGGMVVGFQKGAFQTGEKSREGFRVHYTIEAPDGKLVPGRLDIAALPVRNNRRSYQGADRRKEQSLKMSLFMLRDAINGLWFLQQLSPGYAPLMPFMLADKEHTISQLWSESAVMSRLLPAGDEDFIEGDVKEASDQ